jgi:hypothetical protein
MVPRQYGVRNHQYKLMRFYPFDEWEFYDLKKDPDELSNEYKSPAYASQIAEMKTELDRLRQHYDDDSDVTVQPNKWQKKMRTRATAAVN